MRPPLHGIRVVDLTVAAAGPFATTILAEQGADVIKVERPGSGDFMRSLGTVHNGVTGVFAGFNRGKRAVALDLKDPEGLALLHRLVATADVFVHNLRPGVDARIGVDAATLRAIKDELIYVSISGYGLAGPYAQRPAYDSVMQASSGLAAHQADASGHPQLIRNAVCDKTTALTAAQLITAALLARERGDGPSHVHVSMLHAAIAFLWPDGMQDVTFLDAAPRTKTARATSPPIRRTADGYISITTLLDREFTALCEILDLGALVDDVRFANPGDRSRNADALHPIVNDALLQWLTDELATRLEEEGVPHAVVNFVDRIHDDPQVVALGLLVESEHPEAGRMRVPRPPGEFDGTAFANGALAPRLGQHTDEILHELGIDAAARDDLRSRGVIA
ncbi:MAG TPA: CoA transferase [Acidimicrobiales bacterium]|nr:CoA transferase [Acidimicrobiales bacterium]